MNVSQPSDLRQRGMVLVSSLLLLLVVTILAVSMFRSFGVDEKIAGNTRDKQLATQAAESAEQYAENWLDDNISLSAAAQNGTAIPGVACPAGFISYTVGEICATPLASPGTLPWSTGVTYTVPTFAVTNNQAMSAPPAYYIYVLNGGASPYTYQIDAVGYGSSPNTVALVEVIYTVKNRNFPAQ